MNARLVRFRTTGEAPLPLPASAAFNPCIAFSNALVEPRDDFAFEPSDATWAELYTLGEATGFLQPIDVRGRIQNQRPQVLFGKDTHNVEQIRSDRCVVNTV